MSEDVRLEKLHEGLELIQQAGGTALVCYEGFEYNVRQPEAYTTAFDSPYVTTLGAAEGLTEERQGVTRKNFHDYLVGTGVYADLATDIGSRVFHDLLTGTAKSALLADNCGWYITYTHNVSRQQRTALNPHAVVRVAEELGHPDVVPGKLVRSRFHASILKGFAAHLASVQKPRS